VRGRTDTPSKTNVTRINLLTDIVSIASHLNELVVSFQTVSDVLGRAGLKSPGLGWAFVGLGLWRC